jgi:AmmeMemoRadiSam system protein B
LHAPVGKSVPISGRDDRAALALCVLAQEPSPLENDRRARIEAPPLIPMIWRIAPGFNPHTPMPAVSTPLIRRPAVAGLFYPADPGRLAREVESLLDPPAELVRAPRAPQVPRAPRVPRALIAPHAGYLYSGIVAGRAYASLGAAAGALRRIVLLGPSHHEWFAGLAVPEAEGFSTPLGEIAVDAAAVGALRELPQVTVRSSAHASEHSLEVQLPFLRHLAPSAAIVPIVTGEASPTEVAAAIETLWEKEHTLIVVSSDLSHYHPYALARERDEATARAILEGSESLAGEHACGCTAINGLNHFARARHLTAELIDLRNSGDTAGDPQRVVGYGAFGYFDA